MRDRDSFYGPSEYEQREDREAFLREVGEGGYDEESREERRNRLLHEQMEKAVSRVEARHASSGLPFLDQDIPTNNGGKEK